MKTMDAEIEEVKQEIRKVEEEIREVGQHIFSVEGQVTQAATEADVAYWRRKEEQLREEKDRLRGKEDRLREEKLLLIKAGTSEGESISKKPKRSPAEHSSLDLETSVTFQSRYIRELLAPPLELPGSARDLREFLSQRRGQLPVMSVDTYVSVKDPELVKLYSPAEIRVATIVEAAWNAGLQRPSNEADSSHILRTLSGDFLEQLNMLAPAEQKMLHLGTTMDSAKNPSSASTASGLHHLKRPDYSLYLRNALVLRWENKMDPADFSLAREENTENLKVWSPLYYGELPYVIGGCCGGSIFQWLKLSPNSKRIVAEPISKLYDLWTPSSLAEFLHSVVQMHRLLQKLQDLLSEPVPVRLYKEIIRENGVTVLLGPDFVHKTLKGMTKDRVAFLRSMYESITGSKYLIQLGELRFLRHSAKLLLRPVGHPIARPGDLKQLKNATHDMLHGLASLHEAGYTHRDLRWENCIRENVQGEWKWIIIDLESAGADGDIWEGEGLVNWDEGTLVGPEKSYTKGSDMYELGKLIVKRLDESGTGVVEENAIRALGEKMMEERGEAAKMLGYVCSKGCARCAMFKA